MKKLLLILGIILFLGLAVAGIGVLSIDKEMPVSKEQKTALTNINLDSYSTIDTNIGIDKVKRCLYKKGAINTCKTFDTYWTNCTMFNETEESECLNLEKIYYTEQEIIEILDEWEKQRISNIADVKISRDNKEIEETTREGVTTIK